jgi:hypothetical protein
MSELLECVVRFMIYKGCSVFSPPTAGLYVSRPASRESSHRQGLKSSINVMSIANHLWMILGPISLVIYVGYGSFFNK